MQMNLSVLPKYIDISYNSTVSIKKELTSPPPKRKDELILYLPYSVSVFA